MLKSGGKTEDDSIIQENGGSDNVDGTCSQPHTIKVIFVLLLIDIYLIVDKLLFYIYFYKIKL